MNQENAHEYLPLIQAFADGKNLQFQTNKFGNSYWRDFGETEEIGFYDGPEYYRIKPEPRTFVILRNKYSGQFHPDIKGYGATDAWERITVQEVLK